MGLETATGGGIELGDKNIAVLPVRSRRPELLRSLQMVFQNPEGTLNPSYSVGHAIARVVKRFGIEKDRRRIRDKVIEILDVVRMPAEFLRRKPRQLSGGQKQRVAIARAFVGNPAIVVCDEPVSALDVSVQAAVINLLMEVQEKYETTLLVISHDLSLVRYIARTPRSHRVDLPLDMRSGHPESGPHDRRQAGEGARRHRRRGAPSDGGDDERRPRVNKSDGEFSGTVRHIVPSETHAH